MTVQILQFDHIGEHQKDLKKTQARLLKGGSWKKQRTIVILPAGDMLPAQVALSQWALAFPPNNGVVRLLAQGMEVGDAYSSTIEGILANADLAKWEYLLTIEHDNVPPADGVIRLMEQMEAHPEFSCIGGLYFCKGPGGCAHIWGDIKDPVRNYRPQIPNGGLMECYGTSMGFNLWRVEMFKDSRLKRPFFKTLNGKDGMGVGTQDLTFWNEAGKYYRCAVDTSVKVGHLDYDGSFGPKGMVW